MSPEIKTLTEEKHIKILNYKVIVYNLKGVSIFVFLIELRFKRNMLLKKKK